MIFAIGGDGQHTCDSNKLAKIVANKFVEISREPRKKSKVILTWSYVDMLTAMYEDMPNIVNCFVIDEAKLETKNVEYNHWSLIESKPRNNGTNIEWGFNVTLCRAYEFRITMIGTDMDITKSFFSVNKTLASFPTQDIIRSSFFPDPPMVNVIDIGTSDATITWQGSDCANFYVVDIAYTKQRIEEDYEVYSNAKIPTSLTIPNLPSCTYFTIFTSACIERDKNCDTTETKIWTHPNYDITDNINITSNIQIGYVELEWDILSDLSCIPQYQLRLCPVDNPTDCDEKYQLKKTPDDAHMRKQFTDLENCTKYLLEIKPIFESLTLKTKYTEFTSNCPGE